MEPEASKEDSTTEKVVQPLRRGPMKRKVNLADCLLVVSRCTVVLKWKFYYEIQNHIVELSLGF